MNKSVNLFSFHFASCLVKKIDIVMKANLKDFLKVTYNIRIFWDCKINICIILNTIMKNTNKTMFNIHAFIQ